MYTFLYKVPSVYSEKSINVIERADRSLYNFSGINECQYSSLLFYSLFAKALEFNLTI